MSAFSTSASSDKGFEVFYFGDALHQGIFTKCVTPMIIYAIISLMSVIYVLIYDHQIAYKNIAVIVYTITVIFPLVRKYVIDNYMMNCGSQQFDPEALIREPCHAEFPKRSVLDSIFRRPV